MESRQNHHVPFVLHKALGLLDDHFGHLYVARRRLVECGTDHFALHRPLHIRHFFGPLVDQQHDEHDFRVIGCDGIGDRLQQHGLAGAGWRHNQTTLALAHRRQRSITRPLVASRTVSILMRSCG